MLFSENKTKLFLIGISFQLATYTFAGPHPARRQARDFGTFKIEQLPSTQIVTDMNKHVEAMVLGPLSVKYQPQRMARILNERLQEQTDIGQPTSSEVIAAGMVTTLFPRVGHFQRKELKMIYREPEIAQAADYFSQNEAARRQFAEHVMPVRELIQSFNLGSNGFFEKMLKTYFDGCRKIVSNGDVDTENDPIRFERRKVARSFFNAQVQVHPIRDAGAEVSKLVAQKMALPDLNQSERTAWELMYGYLFMPVRFRNLQDFLRNHDYDEVSTELKNRWQFFAHLGQKAGMPDWHEHFEQGLKTLERAVKFNPLDLLQRVGIEPSYSAKELKSMKEKNRKDS